MTMLQFRTRLRVLAPFRRLMVAVFCVALTVRLGVFFWLYGIGGEQQFLFGDSLRYLSLADSTLAGAGYMYDGILETFRLPGYPAFFMALRLLHLPLLWGSIIQIVCASGIAVWAMWFARMRLHLSERIAIGAGLIAALEPIQVYYSVILLPDVFFAVAFLVAFTYTLRWLDSERVRDAVIVGLAIGIGNYIRPVMMYFPAFIALMWIGSAIARSRSVRTPLIASLIVFVLSFGLMCPWYVRNQVLFGHFSFMSMKEYTLYVYGAASINATTRGVPYETAKQELLAKARAEAPNPNIATFANDAYYRDETMAIILPHPILFLKLYALGLTSFWTSGNYQYLFKSVGLIAPPSESISYSLLVSSKGLIVAIETFFGKITEPFIAMALFDRLFWACMFSLSLLGIWLYRKTHDGWFALVTYLYFSATILSTVIGVEARHRYAVNPILFAFALAAIGAAYRRFSRTIKAHEVFDRHTGL